MNASGVSFAAFLEAEVTEVMSSFIKQQVRKKRCFFTGLSSCNIIINPH